MRFRRAIALAVALAATAATAGTTHASSASTARLADPLSTAPTAQTYASPLEAARAIVEREVGAVTRVSSAETTHRVAGPQRAYASVWTVDAQGGQRTVAVISARETPTGPLSSILLVEAAEEGAFTPYAMQRSEGRYQMAAAAGIGNLACQAALQQGANSGLKKIIESATRRTLYGVVIGVFISAVCAGPAPPGTQYKGATWHNGLFADAYGPYGIGLVGALEDVVVRPYSCAAGTPGISEPCMGVAGSTVGHISVQIHQTTVWPDGVIVDRYYRCDRTFCYQPAYQHEFYATEGTYWMAVFTEESGVGSIGGYIPSGGIRRAFVVG